MTPGECKALRNSGSVSARQRRSQDQAVFIFLRKMSEGSCRFAEMSWVGTSAGRAMARRGCHSAPNSSCRHRAAQLEMVNTREEQCLETVGSISIENKQELPHLAVRVGGSSEAAAAALPAAAVAAALLIVRGVEAARLVVRTAVAALRARCMGPEGAADAR